MLLSALLLSLALTGSVERTSAGQETYVASGRGLVHLAGGDAIIEVLVVVQSYEDASERVRRALKDIHPGPIEFIDDASADGRGEFESASYTTNGLVWDTLPVTVNYNAAGVPASIDDLGALQRAMASWNAVPTSLFEYVYGGTTTRCPSLYDGCPGSQAFDGNNDVGWDDIAADGVLGVTWYSTNIDEFDMVIDNADFTWYTGALPVASGAFDLETVNLHELGHAVGLGHSSTYAAVMYPSVSSGVAKRTPDQDDADGISSLYPAPTPTPTSTPTSTPSATPTPTPTPAPDTTPTATPTATTTSMPTNTPAATATPTTTPTNTPTPTPISTPETTATPTNTPTLTPISTPETTATPTNTPTLTPISTPETTATPTPTKQPNGDMDNDGCLDSQEIGPDETLGGRRDYLNFWDFVDLNRDRSVGLLDILVVLRHFGTVGDPSTLDLDAPEPPSGEYWALADRGGQAPGGDPWDELPANGSITFTDFLSVLRQFGHTCA